MLKDNCFKAALLVVWVEDILSASIQPAGACGWCFLFLPIPNLKMHGLDTDTPPTSLLECVTIKMIHFILSLKHKNTFNDEALHRVDEEESLKDILRCCLGLIFMVLAIFSVANSNFVHTNSVDWLINMNLLVTVA